MKESRSDSNDGCAHWWQYVTIDARLFKWRSVLEFEFVVVPESAADTFTWDMCVVNIEVGRLKGRWQDGCCIKRQCKIWLGCDRHWWCSFCIRDAREMIWRWWYDVERVGPLYVCGLCRCICGCDLLLGNMSTKAAWCEIIEQQERQSITKATGYENGRYPSVGDCGGKTILIGVQNDTSIKTLHTYEL